MDAEIANIVQAIVIASDPLQQDKALQSQAVNYLAQVSENAQGDEVWKLALELFIAGDSSASGRKYDSQTRLFALRLLETFLDSRFTLDDATSGNLKDKFVEYIQTEYIGGPAEQSASFLRNKFSHTFSLLFLCTYQSQWTSFFGDLFALIRTPSSSDPSSSSSINLNTHIAVLFFRTILEISGEISDQLLKSARAYHPERHARDGRVRDCVRERDARGLNDAVVGIVTECLSYVNTFKSNGGDQNMIERLEEVVDWGIKAFSSYIHWIDISLTCTPDTIQLLFSILSSAATPQSYSLSIRLATVTALQRMIAKGLKEPKDKIDLLRVLDMGKVLGALEERTREARKGRPEDDDQEEQFRESLGKLLSTLGPELLDLTKEDLPEEIRTHANQMLEELYPVTIQLVADEYDDTSSTAFPFVHALLLAVRKSKKAGTGRPLVNLPRDYLQQLFQILIEKSKWDSEDDPYDMDEDDKAQFETLRRDTRTFMEIIYAVEPDMVANALCTFTLNFFGMYETQSDSVAWQQAELAAYLVSSYVEICKGPSRGRAAFCNLPPSATIRPEKGVPKPVIDYAQFELTPQGQMLMSMIRSNVVSHPHVAVAMQVFECVVRYPDFFKIRKECVAPVLEALIDVRGIHSSISAVQLRSYYLFHRFIKEQQLQISPQLATTLLERVSDTLSTEAEIPVEEISELSADATLNEVLSEIINHAAKFDAQVSMFEATGTLLSILFRDPEPQRAIFRNLVQPILNQMESGLQLYRANPNPPATDTQALVTILTLHHDITALGHFAKGFPDMPSNPHPGYIPPPIPIFQQSVEAILVALDTVNHIKIIRDAARSSFSKILAPAGLSVTSYIPQFMTSLIQQFEMSELADFLNFLGLLVHKLQTEMFGVLDELQTPLLEHVASIIAQAPNGREEKIAQTDTRKAYMTFLNNIVVSKLQGVFTSGRNKPHFERLLEMVILLSQDVNDPQSEKFAFQFLARCISIWARPTDTANGLDASDSIPGFERFVYEHLIPLAFKVPSMPEFNIKDGQMVTVCYEIAGMIQTICQTRGKEAYDYLADVFFPGVQCPQPTAHEFLTAAKDMDGKGFRKYFTDFVRASKRPSTS